MKITKKELVDSLVSVSQYAFETAEMLKAYILLSNAPISISDDPKIKELMDRVKLRLDHISSFQNNKRHDSGFCDPPDVNKKVAFVVLRERLKELPNIKSILDIGCFSGWLGRNLSLYGYQVHGIDLDDKTLEMARYMAAGTTATFENLTAEKAGHTYPKKFDAVVLFDVLEHLFDTDIGIKSAEMATKDEGWIFINLPMSDTSMQSDFVDSDDMAKEHIHLFTEQRVKELFGEKNNISIEIIHGENDVDNWFISYKVVHDKGGVS